MPIHRLSFCVVIAALALIGSPAVFAQTAPSSRSPTPLRYVSFFKNKSVPGMDRLECDTTILIDGPLVYVGSHYGGGVNILQRDLATGELKFLGFIDMDAAVGKPGQHMDSFTAIGPGGILYVDAVATHAHDNNAGFGLFWFKINKDGASRQLGKISADAGSLVSSPDHKSLYLQAHFTGAVYRYALAEDGTPTQAQKIDGKGLFGSGPLSPDGKFLYSVSTHDHSIGWISIKKDGSLAPGGSIDYADQLKPVGEIRTSTMSISPDGRHAYVALWGYGERDPNGKFTHKYNALAVYARDAATGELKFSALNPADERMNNIDSLLFRPDGKLAYYAAGSESSGNCAGWVTRDPETGSLTYGGCEPHAVNAATAAWAPDTGTLYIPVWKIGNSGVHILQTDPAEKK